MHCALSKEVAAVFLQMRNLLLAAAFLAGFSLIGGFDAMAGLAKPTGATILIIDGKIGDRNDGETAVFDRSMLEEMPASVVRTMTPWTDGVQEFRGVRLVNLLEAVKAQGTTITLTALNEYSIDLDLRDYLPYQPLVAYNHNGKPMPIVEKGPLWLVFPQDDNPAIDRADVHDLWVWQLYRVTVR